MAWLEKLSRVIRGSTVTRTAKAVSAAYPGQGLETRGSSPFVIGKREGSPHPVKSSEGPEGQGRDRPKWPDNIKTIRHSRGDSPVSENKMVKYTQESPVSETKMAKYTQPGKADIYFLKALVGKPLGGEATLPPLSEEQAEVLEAVKRGVNVFFTGPAGSGKTLLISYIKQYLTQQGIQFAVTAPTGVAALLLGGGTIHSWAGLGKGDQPIYRYIEKLRRNISRMNEFKNTEVLIIDEISMLAPDLFQKVNALIKYRRNSKEFMGGMQLIATGDFFQLPPVAIEADRTCYKCGTLVDFDTKRKYLLPEDEEVVSLDPYLEVVGVSNLDWTICSRIHQRSGRVCGHMWNPTVKYAYQTMDWLEANFENFTLTQVFRQTDQEWIGMLEEIKKGEGFQHGKISAVLDSLKRPLGTLPSGIKPTILHTHRASSKEENKREYAKLGGEEVVYRAVDSGAHVEGLSDQEDKIIRKLKQKDFIEEAFFKNVAAQETLALKPGAQVMLLTNLSTDHGLVNGSRGVVTSFKRYTRAELEEHDLGKERLSMLFGNNISAKHTTIPIPLVTFIPPPSNPSLMLQNIPIVPDIFDQSILQPAGYYLRLKRVQLPLAWAWAFTIHKCQGMSLDYAIINIEKAFLPGQGYVALSRVRNTQGLQIKGEYDRWDRIFFSDPSVGWFLDHMKQKKETAARKSDHIEVEKLG